MQYLGLRFTEQREYLFEKGIIIDEMERLLLRTALQLAE